MIDEKLNMTQEWDKVFPQSGKTDHRKVTFHNRYGITLAADLYAPKDAAGKLPAIAVSGPFGAVKERSSSLYAQRMAEYGFLTLAFDPSFTRLLPARAADSPGMVLPRTSTSKISALRWIFCPYRTMQTRRASGSSASAVGAVWRSAAQDIRIKATAAMTMYDMTRVNANGYFDSEDTADARYEKKAAMNKQRTEDYKSGNYALAGGVVDPLPEDAPQFVKD